ncbi:MAG: DUF92 domain-containing protein [Candidatus Heimdallarchaeota archaeon]|nr:DUF92 domain-containing protein [Candidatus Heimdallarchaeota archaeon]
MNSFVDYLIISLIWGIILNVPLLFLILWKNLLTIPDGLIVGGIVTLTIYLISPFLWSALLTFFLSSSLVSKWKKNQKHSVSLEFSKDSKRDSLQVISNSFPAILFGTIFLIVDFFPIITTINDMSLIISSPWLFAAFASFATHNADTWMTEIGIITNTTPRLITNLRKRVPRGTSGGVTIIGSIAGMIGSMIISTMYILSSIIVSEISWLTIVILFILLTIAGIIGGFIDSFEGATVQGIFYCKYCLKETEREIHKCGNETEFLRGYRVITNDFVNISSAFISGCIAGVLYWFYTTFFIY